MKQPASVQQNITQMLVATSSSLLIPQLFPTSELGLRTARRVIQAKCRRNGATLLERDFSDLHKKRRGQASKRLTTSKILNKVGNTGQMRSQLERWHL